jgi:hypothetical protein
LTIRAGHMPAWFGRATRTIHVRDRPVDLDGDRLKISRVTMPIDMVLILAEVVLLMRL